MERPDNNQDEERQCIDSSSKDTGPAPAAPSQDEAYKGLLKKAADLRRLNAELQKTEMEVVKEADAVLSSAGAGTSTGSVAQPKGMTRPRSGENRSPNPMKAPTIRTGGGGSSLSGLTPKAQGVTPRSQAGAKQAAPRPEQPTQLDAPTPSRAQASPRVGLHSRTGSASASRRDSFAAEGEDGEDELGAGLSAEALVRIQKARISVLSKQLQEALEAGKDMDKKVISLEAEVRRLIDEKRKASAKAKTLEAALDKAQRVKSETETSGQQKAREAEALDRELSSYRKAVKTLEADNKNKEVRLNRALEEVERCKATLASERANRRGDGSQEKKEVNKLEGEVKRLERQKGELLSAFKKQTRLISLLKRQKLHLEAARLMFFTEEEFMKVLDWA